MIFSMRDILLQEAVFFVTASLILLAARQRYVGALPFPGPITPWPSWFKIWFAIIWLFTIFLPLGVWIYYGFVDPTPGVALALGMYLLMLFLQVGSEQVCQQVWKSVIWVAVPCLYLPWRLWQCFRGLDTVGVDAPWLVTITLELLIVLWVINIGVHFSGIPTQMRSKYVPWVQNK
jgi:hypothetical protein